MDTSDTTTERVDVSEPAIERAQLSEPIIERRRWRNDTGNQRIYPLRQITPTTLPELQAAVRAAEEDRCTIRAVGSGHSWSDVALTDGILVRPDGLTKPLDLDRALLQAGAGDPDEHTGTTLVQVQAGMRIAELNSHLQARGLALPNMGGFDGQTVAGVISTSTHGSGIAFGPLSDFVRSLEVVAARGVVYRIEPQDGITDAAAYAAKHPDRQLVKDDDWFNAAVVGVGCMGLIYSLILAVRPLFYLREKRWLSTWAQVSADLAQGAESAVLTENAHYEVLFNPYPPDPEGKQVEDVECLITTRNPVTPSEYRHDHRRSRSLLMELAARFPLTPVLIDLAVRLWPKISPFLISKALKALVNPDYVNISYRVLNIGAANYLPAYSCEIGVPIDERKLHLQAVEKIVEVAARRKRLGGVYHSSPISLRFVKATDSHLSMMQGRDTVMIELIMSKHTVGGMELLAAHERALYGLCGRPHWGQVNSLTGSDGLVEAMYPRYGDWQRVHEALNASGVFDSPFSRRVGFSPAKRDA
ncbi:MAG TPA: FAD-binding protein [Solirubrobacteraceae bacterium]|nr:FAD-binding protein [Solirubrobacteraceae bacterium]